MSSWDDDSEEATHIFGGAADAALSQSWSVNVSETDTRAMTGAEIGEAYGRGVLNPEQVFVWREGMSDWIALGRCTELADVLVANRPEGQTQTNTAITAAKPLSPAAAAWAAYGPSADAPPAPAKPPTAARAVSFGVGGTQPGVSPLGPTAPGISPLAGPTPQSAGPGISPLAPARQRMGSVPSFPAPISAGASPLRGPMPANAAVGSGAFSALHANDPRVATLGGVVGGTGAHSAQPPASAQAVPAASVGHGTDMSAAALAAAQQQGGKGGGLKLGLIVGGGVALVAVLVTVVLLLVRSPAQQAHASSSAGGSAVAAADGGDEDAAASSESGNAAGAPSAKSGGRAKGTLGPSTGFGDAPAKSSDKDPKSAASAKASADTSAKTDAKKADVPAPDLPPFNVDAARGALNSAAGAAGGCGKPGGPTGRGRATVTFAPNGSAASASVDPPFAGTPVGTRAVAAFRGARVPPFSGSSQSVTKSFFVK
jgi:hypothetical protein